MTELRVMAPSDRAYVVKTWALSSRAIKSWRGLTIDERFVLCAGLVDRGALRIVVSGHPNGEAHAWAAVENGKLRYVYVAKDLRGYGVARKVIDAALAAPLKEAA